MGLLPDITFTSTAPDKVGANIAFEPTRVGTFFVHRYAAQYQFSETNVFRTKYIVFANTKKSKILFGLGAGYFKETSSGYRDGPTFSAEIETWQERGITFNIALAVDLIPGDNRFVILAGIHGRIWDIAGVKKWAD
ncbi:MAG: hypothetical protein J0L53_13600 [Spirochaetes bacterium]|nr:hypothetical protein [Spirochaetota bacterium]MBX3722294.1 hypothetical protein [Turneriella sp.]